MNVITNTTDIKSIPEYHLDDCLMNIKQLKRITSECLNIYIEPGKYYYLSNYFSVIEDGLLLFHHEYKPHYLARSCTDDIASLFFIDVIYENNQYEFNLIKLYNKLQPEYQYLNGKYDSIIVNLTHTYGDTKYFENNVKDIIKNISFLKEYTNPLNKNQFSIKSNFVFHFECQKCLYCNAYACLF